MIFTEKIMLTESNIQQIESHGLSKSEIERQLQIFKKGIPFAKIVEAASAENGIEVLSENEQQKLVSFFEAKKNQLELLKFVPASGAATRMFKFLHQFLANFNPEQYNIDLFLEDKKDLHPFFYFYEDLFFSVLDFKLLYDSMFVFLTLV